MFMFMLKVLYIQITCPYIQIQDKTLAFMDKIMICLDWLPLLLKQATIQVAKWSLFGSQW